MTSSDDKRNNILQKPNLKILITVGFILQILRASEFYQKLLSWLKIKHEVSVICLSDNKISDYEDYEVKRILRNQNLLIRWIKTIFSIISEERTDCLLMACHGILCSNLFKKKLIRKIVGDWAWERGRNKGLIMNF